LIHEDKNDFNLVVYQQKLYAKCGFLLAGNPLLSNL
jgi:hypothetical protein